MSSARAAVAPRTPLSTPKKSATVPSAADSPGNWSHPRLAEITRRKNASIFTDKNARTIVYNVLVLALVFAVRTNTWLNKYLQRYTPSTRDYVSYASYLANIIALTNIAVALLPLFRQPDPVEDIPLTATQRQLLGLPPSSAPPTPGSVYSTPPRYSRTPSISGSVGGGSAAAKSYASSPLSGKGGGSPAATPGSTTATAGGGSPLSGRRLSASPFSPSGGGGPGGGVGGSPLLQKAMNGRRTSFGGSPGSLMSGGSGLGLNPGSGGGVGGGIFADSPAGTPSPSGKRTSVGLNSKWLYEKGRRSSGSAWVH